MRLTHEGPTNDVIDTELIELKFIFDRSKFSGLSSPIFGGSD